MAVGLRWGYVGGPPRKAVPTGAEEKGKPKSTGSSLCYKGEEKPKRRPFEAPFEAQGKQGTQDAGATEG
jgi:hypothetical protein